LLVWLNFYDAIRTFGLKPAYLQAGYIFFLLGITKIIDMGTGVNGQLIATSTRWRFELVSGVILLVVMLPLTYILTKQYGLIGPAIGSLVSISIYNMVRIIFLWKNFGLFPFTRETVYTLALAGVCYGICYFFFRNMTGFPGLVTRSVAFISLYAGGVIYLKLSPDIRPVVQTIRKKLGLKKNQ
jgi:O-antigen/teichoic acid export membrane protein